jgi:hypothetical protein
MNPEKFMLDSLSPIQSEWDLMQTDVMAITH